MQSEEEIRLDTPRHKVHRFGEFVLDESRCALFRGDTEITLRKQALDMLLLLVRHQGELLDKDLLMHEIWGGMVVTENSITQCLKDIRQAIGDKDLTLIRTVPRRGYIFQMPVSTEDANGRHTEPATQSASRLKGWIVTAALAIVLLGWFAYETFVPGQTGGGDQKQISLPARSVAVLPFVDMSPGGDQAFFGDGIAEEVIDELTGLEGLRVASRTSSFAYRESNTDTRTIANALNVAAVLEGSVRRNGERIRITAQLINAADGYHLWSKTFEREFSDIFVIQDEIAEAVAGALGVRLKVGDVNAFRGAGTTLVEAYEAYLRGFHTPLFPRTESNERIRFFERAIEIDPYYAAAWAALGLTLGSTMWISSVDEAPMILNRAIPILQRAIDLGPNSSYAYTMFATVNYARFDWISSEQFYLKAMEILPDGTAFSGYANMLMRSGRSTESLRYFDRADMAERNAKSPTGLVLWTYAATGEIDKLDEMGHVKAGPGGFPFSLVTALNAGSKEVLRQELRALTAATAATNALQEPILEHFDSADQVLAILRSVYEDRDVEWPSKYHDIALLATFYGDPELALTAISYEARQTTIRYGALWFPVMSEMRKLPGFKQLVKDVNLVEYWRSYGWTDHCRPIGADDFECF